MAFMTSAILNDQTMGSRLKNIRERLVLQLDMQFATLVISDTDRFVEDYGFSEADLIKLVETIQKDFPFVFPQRLLKDAKTVGQMVDLIYMQTGII